jgi:Holliday junction resolvase-like predicted endonuclease
MVGYDGKTLAFVEVRTRTVREEMSALPELSVTPCKQHLLARTAHNSPGKPPVVRLHKDAFSPQM